MAYAAAAGLRRMGVFQNDGRRSTPRKLRITDGVSALTPAGDPGVRSTAALPSPRHASIIASRPPIECPSSTGGSPRPRTYDSMSAA